MTDDKPDRDGGGFARQPEQQEKIHTGMVESITIPWRRAINTCWAAGFICVCIYAIWACVWFAKRIDAWHTHWWEPWLDLLQGIGRIWPWLLIPWLLLCLLVWFASYLGNIVQVLNEKWWPVLTAVDPGEYGLLGILFGKRRQREDVEMLEAEAEGDQMWTARIQVDSPGGAQRIYGEFLIPARYAENWQRFADAVSKPEGFLVPRFSKAGAHRFNLPWEVFQPIQREFMARGLAWQEASMRNNGTVHLRAIGRAVCRAFATTPPPEF